MFDFDALNGLLFFGGAIILASIFAGSATARFGAPLLLVFLCLGMSIGDDGFGVAYDDFRLTFGIGSAALAVVLFDGGMRTPLHVVRLAAAPALALATVGTAVAAGLVAVALRYIAGLSWPEAGLVGAMISSTDAAAVFLLLGQRGMRIHERVRASLEVESGINDPVAIFLVATFVTILDGFAQPPAQLALSFLWEMAGGAMFGAAAGWVMVWVMNRFQFAQGLYPIFAVAGALCLFGGAQYVHASGFLAVYVAGLVVGNTRHRGTQLIIRFHDGLAWLSQIVMFVMLGILVTPREMVADLPIALLAAVVLMVVGRPIGVFLSLAPLRFSWRESAFISWVGLRGAVPIFLATIPILADLPNGKMFFHIAFVVVLASLVLQGWTIGLAGRWFQLELPKETEETERMTLDLASDIDRDIAGYQVGAASLALDWPFTELPLPKRVRVLAVIRGGVVLDRGGISRLTVDDNVMVLAPPDRMIELDRLFGPRIEHDEDLDAVFGEFTINGQTKIADLALMYGLAPPKVDGSMTVDEFIRLRLRRRIVVGDRLPFDAVELVVREKMGDRITSVGLELEPADRSFRAMVARMREGRRLRARFNWLRRRLAPR